MVYGRLNVDRARFFQDAWLIDYVPDGDQDDLDAAETSGWLSHLSRHVFRAQLGNERAKRRRWWFETGLGPRFGGGRVTRVHGPFVSDEEVEEVVRHLKTQGEPEYVSAVTEGDEDSENAAAIDEILGLGGDGGEDALYDQAVMIVARDRKCSTSYIQRKLAIGYNKAARLVEQMEDQGVVSPANHVGKREVLIEER